MAIFARHPGSGYHRGGRTGFELNVGENTRNCWFFFEWEISYD